MKILHITNNYPSSKYPVFGIFVKEQIESISNKGITNSVFIIEGREKGKVNYLLSSIKIFNLLRKHKFDLIHCHHAFSALSLIISQLYRQNKVLVSYQNDPLNENGNYLFRFILKKVDCIILKNNSILIDNKKILYQPNGVNINLFNILEKNKCKTILNLNENKRYILFVSSNFIRQQKRYDKFCEVLNILKNKYRLTDIEELLLINTNRHIVPYFFNAASLHLLTSDYEGSPNSVKEAMACNTPVVSTNVGNVVELLEDVNGSYVAYTNSVEELAELAFKALENPFNNNGRQVLIEKKLDIDSVANNIISIYKKILYE